MLFQTAKSRVYRKKSDAPQPTNSSGPLDSLVPVLEEQPKWGVLAEVLEEIERDMYLNPVPRGDSNSTILIMCNDQQTCRQVREYLSTMHYTVETPNDDEQQDLDTAEESAHEPSGQFMLQRRLREYITWRRNLKKVNDHLYGSKLKPKERAEVAGYASISASRKYPERAPPNKRRRVRGGSASASTPSRAHGSVQIDTDDQPQESELLESVPEPADADLDRTEAALDDDLEDMEKYYELYDMDDLVLVHPFGGDMDEHVLEETRPRYIIMYEPDAAFIRRVEVYRSSHTDRNVRVYFLYYEGSVEEQRYLSAVRREKDAFTKLIKEKGVCGVLFLKFRLLCGILTKYYSQCP